MSYQVEIFKQIIEKEAVAAKGYTLFYEPRSKTMIVWCANEGIRYAFDMALNDLTNSLRDEFNDNEIKVEVKEKKNKENKQVFTREQFVNWGKQGAGILKPRIKVDISAEEFKKKYYNMKVVDLAKELGVSQGQITILARRFGVALKGRGKRFTEVELPIETTQETYEYSEELMVSKDVKEKIKQLSCNGLFSFSEVISKLLQKVGF